MQKTLFPTLLFLAACSEPAPRPDTAPQPEAAPPASTPATATGCAQFTREGLKLKARTLAGLTAEAGRPFQTTVTVEPNRHVPNVQDSIFVFRYDGMTVQMRKPGPGGELFERVIVDKRKWLTFPFFQPGVTAENVISALGEPQRREPDRLVYRCDGEAEEPVVFETRDGAVQRIIFNYYVD